MNTTGRILYLLGITIVVVSGASVRQHNNKPQDVECTSNGDCLPGYCCMIAFERYSYPRCERTRVEGDSCRPSGPLVTSGSRYYPDMSEIVLNDVYMMFCPCSVGLSCKEGVCRENNNGTNYLTNQTFDD